MAQQTALELERSPDRVGWGGRRRGAGRKRVGRGVHPHGVRPWLAARHPVHVVLRVTHEVGALRRGRAYHAVRRALITSLGRDDFRIVHLSIQRHHLHLIVEADDRLALSRGVRGFEIAAARALNAAVTRERPVAASRERPLAGPLEGRGAASRERPLAGPRRGRVFIDRYHATQLTSPTQVRGALAYVLNNWRHHREDGGALRHAAIDPFSSAIGFPGWAGRDSVPFAWPRRYVPLPVAYPTTWLLTGGWRRGGPTISMDAVPGPAPGGRSDR